MVFPENAITLDGKTLAWGVKVTADSPMGVVAHEFCHDLGAPDLYDIDLAVVPEMFSYPIMMIPCRGLVPDGKGRMGLFNKCRWKAGQRPTHLCGYLKWKMGWIEPQIITTPKSLSIKSIEDNRFGSFYLLPKGMPKDKTIKEYFVIETGTQYPIKTLITTNMIRRFMVSLISSRLIQGLLSCTLMNL